MCSVQNGNKHVPHVVNLTTFLSTYNFVPNTIVKNYFYSLLTGTFLWLEMLRFVCRSECLFSNKCSASCVTSLAFKFNSTSPTPCQRLSRDSGQAITTRPGTMLYDTSRKLILVA